MGVVKKRLAEFELSDGSEWRIEYNANETVHIHIDNLRIVKTREEFLEFVDTLQKGHSELRDIKSVD